MHYETERLTLRIPNTEDAACVFRIYGDPVTNQFNPAGPHADQSVSNHVLDTWIEHWETHGFGLWAIADKTAPQQVIGFGGLSWLDKDGLGTVLNLGYRFAPSAWGQGLATELGRGAIDYAQQYLEVDALYGLVRNNHEKSIRVLEKPGFEHFDHLHDVPGASPSLVLRLVLR